jgi:hypothetical protein
MAFLAAAPVHLTTVIAFFHLGCQPQLNQPQQFSIHYSPRQALHKFGVWNRVERTLDTLPTTITSMAIPSRCRLFEPTTLWKAKRWRCWVGVTDKVSSICC